MTCWCSSAVTDGSENSEHSAWAVCKSVECCSVLRMAVPADIGDALSECWVVAEVAPVSGCWSGVEIERSCGVDAVDISSDPVV